MKAHHARETVDSEIPSSSAVLLADEVLVLFPSGDDLIANFFRVDGHASPGRYLKRLESIRGLDEFSLSPDLPLRTSVLEEAFPYRIQPTHMAPPMSLSGRRFTLSVATSLQHHNIHQRARIILMSSG